MRKGAEKVIIARQNDKAKRYNCRGFCEPFRVKVSLGQSLSAKCDDFGVKKALREKRKVEKANFSSMKKRKERKCWKS